MNISYGDRLRAARKHAKLSQAGLADAVGNVISQQGIQYLEKKSQATGSEFTAQFAEACGVRAIWLATGQGEMVDGLYVERQDLKRLVTVCEALPPQVVDQLCAQGATFAELIKESAGKGQ